MDDLHPGDTVEFIGPVAPVRRWPQPAERGLILDGNDDTVRVVWERSGLIVAWPMEWIFKLGDVQG